MCLVDWVVTDALAKQLQETSKKWEYCWLFEVGNMRNTHLSTVRQLWKG